MYNYSFGPEGEGVCVTDSFTSFGPGRDLGVKVLGMQINLLGVKMSDLVPYLEFQQS